jgi:hypothetical protein
VNMSFRPSRSALFEFDKFDVSNARGRKRIRAAATPKLYIQIAFHRVLAAGLIVRTPLETLHGQCKR